MTDRRPYEQLAKRIIADAKARRGDVLRDEPDPIRKARLERERAGKRGRDLALTTAADARLALDRAPLTSTRSVDADGHLRVGRSLITRACVSPYYGREIPDWEILGLDPARTYQLFRDPIELERAAATFAGKPILVQHVQASADYHPRDVVVGAVGEPVDYADGALWAPLTIWDGEAIAAVESGAQRALSCGYRYTADMRAGRTTDGEPFDGVMRDIEANHVALVAAGRVDGAMVGDAAMKPDGRRLKQLHTSTPIAAAFRHDRRLKRLPVTNPGL